MAAEVTQTLAQFAAALRYDDLPPRVREHCKNLLLDALACAVAGRLGEETGQIAALASGAGAGRESSVIGGESSVACRRHLAQRLSRHRGHHVRRASRDA